MIFHRLKQLSFFLQLLAFFFHSLRKRQAVQQLMERLQPFSNQMAARRRLLPEAVQRLRQHLGLRPVRPLSKLLYIPRQTPPVLPQRFILKFIRLLRRKRRQTGFNQAENRVVAAAVPRRLQTLHDQLCIRIQQKLRFAVNIARHSIQGQPAPQRVRIPFHIARHNGNLPIAQPFLPHQMQDFMQQPVQFNRRRLHRLCKNLILHSLITAAARTEQTVSQRLQSRLPRLLTPAQLIRHPRLPRQTLQLENGLLRLVK